VARLLPARAVANVVTDLVDAWDELRARPPRRSRFRYRAGSLAVATAHPGSRRLLRANPPGVPNRGRALRSARAPKPRPKLERTCANAGWEAGSASGVCERGESVEHGRPVVEPLSVSPVRLGPASVDEADDRAAVLRRVELNPDLTRVVRSRASMNVCARRRSGSHDVTSPQSWSPRSECVAYTRPRPPRPCSQS
jgi:hypothetical protein